MSRPLPSYLQKGASELEEIEENIYSDPSSSKSTVVSNPKSRKQQPVSADRSQRELNKRLRDVYTEANEDYGDDVSGRELETRFKLGYQLSQKRVGILMKEIESNYIVDLAFLLDCTGSMQPYVNQVRLAISNIVTKATARDGPAKRIRIAFVGYRDFCDAPEQFEIINFTSNINDFISFVVRIIAKGGGDSAEDVFGGIEKAINLKWDANAGTRIIVHIADAPCHGREFHDVASDDYKSGDPKGRSVSNLFAEMRQKSIRYFFGKITEHTNKMIEKFSEQYREEIVPFNLKIVENLETFVIKSLSTAISLSEVETRAGTKGKALRPYKIDVTEPYWDRLPVENGTFLTYKFPKSVEDLLQPSSCLERKVTPNVRIKIAPKPFSYGAERIAYYGRDLCNQDKSEEKKSVLYGEEYDKHGLKIVLKEYKHVGEGQNTAERYQFANQIQTVATYFAVEFDKLHKQEVKVKFLKVKTLSIVQPTGKIRFMTCEKLLVNATDFIRFTNNVDYKIIKAKAPEKGIKEIHIDILMAFSHWTFQITNGEMMVVDLQGVLTKDKTNKIDMLLLTDPAIHCKDTTRYRPLNLGEQGMKFFFKNHRCNKICNYLKLTKRT